MYVKKKSEAGGDGGGVRDAARGEGYDQEGVPRGVK